VDVAEAYPDRGALAPKMVLYQSPALLNSVGLACTRIGCCWDQGIGRLDAPKWNVPKPVIGVCGGACFLRVAALKKTGLLSADFDEVDLGLRIWNAGYEIWSCPEAVVRHKYGATMNVGKRARRKYYLNTRNKMFLVLRNWPLKSLLRLAPDFFAGEFRAIGRAVRDGHLWRVGAHARAWLTALTYIPRAVVERRDRRRRGIAQCGFWHLIDHTRLFFPGTEFPKDGWYSQRTIGGLRVRPISARAHFHSERCKLRVVLINCYPELGTAEVEVSKGETKLAELRTRGRVVHQIEIPEGGIDFIAGHIFDADDTGEPADFGGWLCVETL